MQTLLESVVLNIKKYIPSSNLLYTISHAIYMLRSNAKYTGTDIYAIFL